MELSRQSRHEQGCVPGHEQDALRPTSAGVANAEHGGRRLTGQLGVLHHLSAGVARGRAGPLVGRYRHHPVQA